jgi:hypothetical protein
MLEIEYTPIGDLIPDINNAREHSDSQIQQIANSINEFGFTNPVLIDESKKIIAGHGRYMAGKTLELPEIPTIQLLDLTDAQKKAYVIADNKLALNSQWDFEKLTTELKELQDLDFDLNLIGYYENELTALLDDPENTEFDPLTEWEGMPEYDQPDANGARTLYVHFQTDDDVAKFFALVGQSYTEKTKYIWYPYKEKNDTESKRYV